MSLTETIKARLVNSIAGVTVHITRNDEMNISYVLLRRIRNKTKIIHSAVNLISFDELAGRIGKGIPVWLSISGRPVISRKLENDPGSRYLNHILPNAREEDFLVNVVTADQNSVFISAIRYDQFNELASSMKEKGLPVLGYSLDAAPLSFLFQSSLVKEPILKIPGYTLTFKSEEISEIKVSDNDEIILYPIGDEQLDSRLLLAFATALSYLANLSGIDQVTINTYITDEESFALKKLNRSLVFTFLGILFVVLLLNFFVFSYFNDKYQSLSGNLSYQKTYFSRRDSLRQEIALKTGLVNQMGLARNTEYGYYIDRLAATVPASVTLNTLLVNPVTEKVKPNQPVEYNKHIRIQGESNGSIVLNEWVGKLDTMKWIHDIEIIRYEKIDHKGEFELKILY